MSAAARLRIAFTVSLFAPGLPLIFSEHPGRGLAYFFGFWISLVVFFPIALFIYVAALGDLDELS